MKEAILIIAVLGIFAYGYFLMGKLDKFLEENRKAIEKESEKKEPSCVMLTDELSNEEITKEIQLYREKYGDIKILLYNYSDVELSETLERHVEGKK